MIIIRPAKITDLDGLYQLALMAGPGMTSLPQDKEQLRSKIIASQLSFAADISTPMGEFYLLVAIDTISGEVLGTANIVAGIGIQSPSLFFKITRDYRSIANGPLIEDTILTPCLDLKGYAELGGLMVSPRSKGSGLGRLLSASRYMLIKSAPHRFPDKLMANIRGWLDQEGRSPVWEAIGRQFFISDFDETDTLYGRGEKAALLAQMPHYPIYTALLPEAAKMAVGRPHLASAPALKLLLQEGFQDEGIVFFIDAGPCVEANLKDIKTLKNSRECGFKRNEKSPLPMIDHHKISMISPSEFSKFSVVTASFDPELDHVALNPEIIDALGLSENDRVHTAPLKV